MTTLTITINAVDPAVAARIYRQTDGAPFSPAAAAHLIEAQFTGLATTAQLGLAVKVNTVLIPGVNEDEVPAVAAEAASRGALLQNVMPLIPLAAMAGQTPPSPALLAAVRARAARHLPQFTGCRQCRADAVGMV
ncbi:MAG TPA: hypothetical protein VGL40_03040 [Bacillota bacterium]